MKKRARIIALLMAVMLILGIMTASADSSTPELIEDRTTGTLIVKGELSQADMLAIGAETWVENLDMSEATYQGTLTRAMMSSLTNLEGIIIPDGTGWIGPDAFKDNQSLKAVYMPDSVTLIASQAFMGCTNLEVVRFSNNLTGIGVRAFQNCTSLKMVDLPATAGNLGASAFQNCSAIETFMLRADYIMADVVAFQTGNTNTKFYVKSESRSVLLPIIQGAAPGTPDSSIIGTTFHDIEIENETAHCAFAQANYGFEGLEVGLYTITNEAPYEFTAVSPNNLAIANDHFTVPNQNVIIRYGEASNPEIEEIESPRTLHLLEGAITSEAGLMELIADIEEVNAVLLDDSTTTLHIDREWSLQQFENDAWEDVDVDVTEIEELLARPGELRLAAEVDVDDYVITGDALAVVPVIVYDVHSHPLQLTVGNNDMNKYWNFSDPAKGGNSLSKLHFEAQYRNLSAEEKEKTLEHLKYALVFNYFYTDRNAVLPYLSEDMIEMIEGEEIGINGDYANTAAWIAAADEAERRVDIIELDKNGNDLSVIPQEIALDNGTIMSMSAINPRHTDNSDDYIDVTGKRAYREEEYYKIGYKVRDGVDMFYVTRDVKLKYKLGDLDLSGAVTQLDGSLMNRYAAQTWNLIEENGYRPANDFITREIGDINGDGAVTMGDGSYANRLAAQTLRGECAASNF